jgi:Type II secretion system (T2SS), protein F
MTAPPTTATAVLAVLALVVATLVVVALLGRRVLRGRARTSRRGPFRGVWWLRGSGLARRRARGGGSRRRRRSASLRHPPIDRRWVDHGPMGRPRRSASLRDPTLDRPAIGRVGPGPSRSSRPSVASTTDRGNDPAARPDPRGPGQRERPRPHRDEAEGSYPENLLGGLRTRIPMGAPRTRIPRPGQAAARRRHMEEAVPEVVGVLRATVAAGVNPRRALQAAAEGAPAALRGVLGQAVGAAELGAGAGQALATAARSERLGELELAGEVLDLAETTGAPPGPVLAGVAGAAADRVRSRQARMAATAQARLSARVVAAMAPAFLGVLALTSPSDAAFLVREAAGWVTLTAAAALELLGIAWSTRIVRGRAP